TGTVGLNVRAGADTQNRFQARGDGQLSWGSGSAAVDTNLYRSAANTLKTDDSFVSAASITASGNLITESHLQFGGSGGARNNAILTPSTTVSNSTSEAVIAAYPIPANDMVAGAVYRLFVFGTINTHTSGTNQLTVRGRIGGLSGTQFAWSTTQTLTNSLTTKVCRAEVYLACSSTGVSGSVFGQLDYWNGAVIAGNNPTNFGFTTNHGHIM